MPDQAKEILDYFLRVPQAADSLEGVARWRLREQTVYRAVDEIEQAIAWLVAHGFLVETPVTGSSPIFSLNRARAAEAAALRTAPRRDRSRARGGAPRKAR